VSIRWGFGVGDYKEFIVQEIPTYSSSSLQLKIPAYCVAPSVRSRGVTTIRTLGSERSKVKVSWKHRMGKHSV